MRNTVVILEINACSLMTQTHAMVTKAQSAIQQQKHLWRRDTKRYKGDLHCNEHRKRKHRWCREQTPQAFSWDGDDPKTHTHKKLWSAVFLCAACHGTHVNILIIGFPLLY